MDPAQLDPHVDRDGRVGRDDRLVRRPPRMRRVLHDPLRWGLFAIAAGTFVSRLLLIAFQRFILDILSAPTTTSDRLFFGIIGMFMAVVGGAMTQALLQERPSEIVLFWSTL